MKRILSVFLVLALLGSLCACGKKAPDVFESNTEAEVAVSYILDGQANIATRALTERTLKKITLACVYYDITGKQIDQRRFVECAITDNKEVLLWQVACPEMAVYVDSVVYSTEDADGNVSTVKNIDLWETSTVEAFQVDTYQQTLSDATFANAELAENNPHANIAQVSWNDPDLSVELEITASDIQVKSVYLFALWFDETGAPVDTGACSYCKNGELMVAHIQVDGAQTYVFTAPENAHSAKLLIQSIDFADGSQWTNPYCYEWILHHRSKAAE